MAEQPEVMSVEIQMDAFRMMRSGRYSTAKALRTAVEEAFPGVPKEKVQQALATLARRLGEHS